MTFIWALVISIGSGYGGGPVVVDMASQEACVLAMEQVQRQSFCINREDGTVIR